MILFTKAFTEDTVYNQRSLSSRRTANSVHRLSSWEISRSYYMCQLPVSDDALDKSCSTSLW